MVRFSNSKLTAFVCAKLIIVGYFFPTFLRKPPTGVTPEMPSLHLSISTVLPSPRLQLNVEP